ncbi:unnamed protein product [Thelazia callipaeda]|uniref:OTU domain-containing protein n=1 Tax=Thelazia callipaeda TaxID=103827 RepID=A0A0N5CVM5_THECL|nr:unnamed protein product [Thelazia callipaeda]
MTDRKNELDATTAEESNEVKNVCNPATNASTTTKCGGNDDCAALTKNDGCNDDSNDGKDDNFDKGSDGSSKNTEEYQEKEKSLMNEYLKSLRVTDSIMEPNVDVAIKGYLRNGGQPEVVISSLTESYCGLAQVPY